MESTPVVVGETAPSPSPSGEDEGYITPVDELFSGEEFEGEGKGADEGKDADEGKGADEGKDADEGEDADEGKDAVVVVESSSTHDEYERTTFTAFSDSFAKMDTSENPIHRGMSSEVCDFLGKPSPLCPVLDLVHPAEDEDSATFTLSLVAAYLASAPHAAAMLVCAEWRSARLLECILILVYETYMADEGYGVRRLSTSSLCGVATLFFETRPGGLRLSHEMVEAQTYRRITIPRSGAPSSVLILASDPADVPPAFATPLTVIDASVLKYHAGHKMAFAALAARTDTSHVIILRPEGWGGKGEIQVDASKIKRVFFSIKKEDSPAAGETESEVVA